MVEGLRSPRWYVVRSHRGHEARVESNLARGRIETLLPWVRTASRRRTTPGREPLFPQYLFARFDPERSLHDVTYTRGVQAVVRVGGELGAVDDDAIEFFRSRMDEHGCIALRQSAAGESVTIERGPFAELTGVVERSLPARQRVIVLLTSVGASMRVEVAADDLCRRGAGIHV